MKLRHELEKRSYVDDPFVPEFDDSAPIVFLDGDCALCSKVARLIDKLDRSGKIRICSNQSPLGRAVMVHYGLDPDDPASWLYLEGGEAFVSLDGLIRLGKRVGGAGRLMQVFRLLPRSAQDGLYRLIARNRYEWCGRADLCSIAQEGVQKRLIG